MKNKYIKGGRLSEAKFRKMLRLFCLDLDATQIAGATNINRNTVNRYLSEIRRRISIYNRIHGCGFCAFKKHCDDLFGNKHKKNTSNGLVIVGINQNSKIRSRTIPEHMEQDIRQGRLHSGPPENNKRYDFLDHFQGVIDLSFMKYQRISFGPFENFKRNRGIEGCEAFWGFARIRLQRFRGLHKSTMLLHLRECEFRYNHDRNDIYPFLLRKFREEPLFANDLSSNWHQ